MQIRRRKPKAALRDSSPIQAVAMEGVSVAADRVQPVTSPRSENPFDSIREKIDLGTDGKRQFEPERLGHLRDALTKLTDQVEALAAQRSD